MPHFPSVLISGGLVVPAVLRAHGYRPRPVSWARETTAALVETFDGALDYPFTSVTIAMDDDDESTLVTSAGAASRTRSPSP